MEMWKLVLGGTAFLIGTVLAVMALFDGHYFGAVGYFASGFAVALSIFLFELWSVSSFWPVHLLAAVATVFFIVDAFTSSHMTNIDEGSAQADFLQVLIAEGLTVGSTPLSDQEKKLTEAAFQACSVQSYKDGQDLAVGAQKAVYFGPTLSLADGVNSALTEKRPVRCLDYYRELRKTKPQLFLGLDKQHPWLSATPAD